MLNKLISEIEKHHKTFDKELVTKGYHFCIEAHKNQKRKSGEPYSNHVLNVAYELAKLKMDISTIVGGMLHDIIEDTEYSSEYIANEFSPEIATLVEGVTKIDKIKTNLEEIKQAENLHKMFLAIAKDIRVLIIKICDRLDNMRTISYHKDPVKIRQIAIETLEVYAPLCERIGVYKIANELQDISFSCINPDLRLQIIEKIQQIKLKHDNNFIKNFSSKIEITLLQNGIKCIVIGREKTPYSIWRKIKKKNATLSDITDIIAFTIIVDSKAECYNALGVLHTSYRYLSEKFFDYISLPKINNYQAIHTCIIEASTNTKLEVQIKTQNMYEESIYGMASHWSYKTGSKEDSQESGYKLFMDNILNIFKSNYSAKEILEITKTEISFERIFVFNENGTIFSLPKNATILDFAFANNPQTAINAIYGIVNGSKKDLDDTLNTNDTIEIIASNTITIKPHYINFCTTDKAKQTIKQEIENRNLIANDKFLIMYDKASKCTKTQHTSNTFIESLIKKYNITKQEAQNFIIQGKIDIIKELSTSSEKQDVYKSDIKNFSIAKIITKKCQVCKPDTTKTDSLYYILVKNYGLIAHSKECNTLNKDVISNETIFNNNLESLN